MSGVEREQMEDVEGFTYWGVRTDAREVLNRDRDDRLLKQKKEGYLHLD